MTLLLATLGGNALAGVVEAPAGTGDLDAVYQPRRVALVVGVDDYADPKLQGLRFASKDATDVSAVLADADVGGFDRVVTLTGAQATSARGIKDALLMATADLQRDDTFLLYMSGHGTLTLDPVEGSRLWFLPSDGELERPEQTGLSVTWLEEAVGELPARRRVMVLDTCHNGRSKSALSDSTSRVLGSMRGDPPAPKGLREVSESEARLYAAQFYQPAMEDPALKNGVYTHYFIQSLTDQKAAADLDRDGMVDVAEAHDYARDKTIRHTGGLQVPRAEYSIVGREEIYLSGDPDKRTSAEQALLSACDEVLAKASLLVDGIPRGELPGLTAVDPGRHRVEVQTEDGRTVFSRRVKLTAGTTLPVEGLMAERQPAWVMMAGPSLHAGEGAGNGPALEGELELTRLQPFSTPDWLVPDLHLRGSYGYGEATNRPGVPINAGQVAAGLSLGARVGPLSVGPSVEAVMPWRVFSNSEGGFQNQATATGAGGARALVRLDLDRVELALRYDLRYLPVYYRPAEAEVSTWTSQWQHGLAVGIVAPR